MDEQTMNILLGVMLVLLALVLAAWAVAFAMKSAGGYTIAKRRGIGRPYLAWFPILRQGILGALVDQYLYVTRGKRGVYRHLLPVLDLLWRLMGVFLLTTVFRLIVEQASFERFLGSLGLFVALPALHLVLRLVARYWLFRSCVGKGGMMYFLLSVFVPMSEPALLLWCCRRDAGMPPRKIEET